MERTFFIAGYKFATVFKISSTIHLFRYYVCYGCSSKNSRFFCIEGSINLIFRNHLTTYNHSGTLILWTFAINKECLRKTFYLL